MLDVKTATTEELREFIRHDIETRTDESDTDLLFEVLNELHLREEAAGKKIRSAEEMWQTFLKHYAPPEMLALENDSTINRKS